MRNSLLVFRLVVSTIFFFAAVSPSALADKPVHTVFKAQGSSANAFLGGLSINGIGDATSIDVFQNLQTGETSVLLRVFSFPNGFDNRTTNFVFGTIPSDDFIIAPDLSSATLNTAINTSPGNFDNADVGPIVGVVINLTWSPDAFGHLIVTSKFSERIPGTTIGHWETFIRTDPAHSARWTGRLVNSRSLMGSENSTKTGRSSLFGDVHTP